MSNFSVQILSPKEKVLTDALGRRILLYSESSAKTKDFDLALRIPVKRVVASSPIDLAFVLRLDEDAGPLIDNFNGIVTGDVLDRFTGIVNVNEAHLILPERVSRLKSGKIKPVATLADFEAVKPDVIFTFAFPHKNPALAGALEDAGLPYAVVDAWYESDLLDRARWLEFYACFFGVEKRAEMTVKKIAD